MRARNGILQDHCEHRPGPCTSRGCFDPEVRLHWSQALMAPCRGGLQCPARSTNVMLTTMTHRS